MATQLARSVARALATTFCMSIMLLASAPASALEQGINPSPTGKIGYVDFNRALNEVSDGKAARKRLNDEFKEKQQRLDLLQSELSKMKEGIDRDRLILSSETLAEKEKAYRDKLLEVQQKFSDFRMRLSEREKNLTRDILTRLRKIVKGIGDREGYALILEKSQELVVYAPSASDLTDDVIREYNNGSQKKRR